MPSHHPDLSMTSNILLAMLAVGYELVGLRTTLLLAVALVVLVLALSVIAALLSQRARPMRPPTHLGGAMRGDLP